MTVASEQLPPETASVDEPIGIHRVAAGAAAQRAVSVIGDRLRAGAATSDLAVLARVSSALLPVQVALSESGIGHSSPLDASVLGRTGIRTALAYLRLGLDLERIRRNDLFDTINRPARKVKSAITPLLKGRGDRFTIEALDRLAASLDETHRDRFGDYLDDLRELEAEITDGADTARCLWVVRNRIGLGEAMDALDASRSRPEGSSHGDDLDALEQLATLQPDPAAFCDWLTQRLRTPGDPGGVTLSTVHRVKGMEWPHVLILAANQGLLPHRLADDVEEERRVFHVAVTRCTQRVDIIADEARTSPFVDELLAASERAPRPAAEDAPPPDAVAATYRPDGSVAAEVGVHVTLPGELAGVIVEVGRDHAIVAVDIDGERVRLRAAYGRPVRVDATVAPLTRPLPGAGRDGTGALVRPGAPGRARHLDVDAAPEVDDGLYEALRAWRARIAVENGVPAYLVFHDRHLQVIAGRKPRTLRELAACPGVGPAKLERYGDDVLDLVDTHAT